MLGADFVLAARARGAGERTVLFGHALRHAALPVLTVVGYNFGFILAGSALIETVFAWPGIGRLLFDSIARRDYPVMTAILLLVSATVVVVNLITDRCTRPSTRGWGRALCAPPGRASALAAGAAQEREEREPVAHTAERMARARPEAGPVRGGPGAAGGGALAGRGALPAQPAGVLAGAGDRGDRAAGPGGAPGGGLRPAGRQRRRPAPPLTPGTRWAPITWAGTCGRSWSTGRGSRSPSASWRPSAPP